MDEDGEREGNSVEGDGDVFGDFLDSLDELQSCNHEDGDAEGQIQALKMEVRFLRTFSKCLSRDEDLKTSSNGVVSACFGRLSSLTQDESCQLSNALQVFEEMRSTVKYFYDQISITSPSYIPFTNDLVVELINDLVQNFEDLLSSKTIGVVNMRCQISDLRWSLQFLKNFLDFVARQCSEHENFKKLLAHSEAMAIEAARISYSCLEDQSTEESTLEDENGIYNLVEKIKPSNPELRKTYVGVLEAAKLPESSPGCLTDELVMGQLLDSFHDLLMEIPKSNPGMMLPALDQLEVLDTELRFIRALVIDPPRKYIGAEDLNDLLRSIGILITELGSLILYHQTDETMEDHNAEMNFVIGSTNLQEKMKCIKFKAREIYLSVSKPSRSKFPKTDGLGFIQYLSEHLEELLLLSQGNSTISLLKHHMETILQEFKFLIPLLKTMERWINQHEKFRSLWIRVLEVAYHTEYIIDSFVMKDGPPWYHMLWLDDVIDEILLVKADVVDINSKVPCDTGVQNEIKHSSGALFSLANSPTTNLHLVGFQDEVEKLTELLIDGCRDQLDIISIVGMPGLGKTTLSRKLYNSPSVKKHFHLCAWCCISQVYQKKDLLLSILGQITQLKDKHYKMDEEDLASFLKKGLMGKRYLIVIDDIWNIEAWRDLQLSFPDTNCGSRIIFTTRILDVALQAKLNCNPYFLRSFTDEESWILLQKLLFTKKSCPLDLLDIGKQIATSCKGLPLSVVLIAGLLATDMTKGFWEQVAKSFSSRIIGDEQSQTLDIIGLSYQHLPYHLKPCFLYLGAFLEDQEIPAKRLIQLWSAEGFVRRVEGKRVEDIARNFLQDLINRSLLTISKHGADGGIKTCRIHDLLSHFCKTKAKEENFWELIDGYDDLFSPDVLDHDVSSDFNCSSTPTYEQHRLCIYSKRNQFVMSRPSGSHVRSLLLLAASDSAPHCPYDASFVCNNFKLLRILNLECLKLEAFPNGLELLVLLRYLALWVEVAFVPSSIAYLHKLETLILEVDMVVVMPESIWKMRKLRHLRVSKLATFDRYDMSELGLEETKHASFIYSKLQSWENTDHLDSLQTISTLSFTKGREEETLRKIPNIRKLSCVILDAMDGSSDCCHFPALELLHKLESVNVFFAGLRLPPLQEITFPSGLKKLTFSGFNLEWENISILGKLENLEVLKLRDRAFEGPMWDMKVGEFPKLKHLELYIMDLEEWKASIDNFNCLKNVKLIACDDLKQIPSCLGEVQTLEMIEVKWCPELEEETIREIEADQVEYGNPSFKALFQNEGDMFGDSDDEDEYVGPVSVFF